MSHSGQVPLFSLSSTWFELRRLDIFYLNPEFTITARNAWFATPSENHTEDVQRNFPFYYRGIGILLLQDFVAFRGLSICALKFLSCGQECGPKWIFTHTSRLLRVWLYSLELETFFSHINKVSQNVDHLLLSAGLFVRWGQRVVVTKWCIFIY